MNLPFPGASEANAAADRVDLSAYRRIVVLTDGYSTPFLAKTAISLLRYRTHDVAALLEREAPEPTAQRLLGAGGDIPIVRDLGEVADADALFVGIAPPGGRLPAEWRPLIAAAIDRKLDIVSGLHDFVGEDGEFQRLAERSGSQLIDVRRNQWKTTARGIDFRHGCVRIQTVGHDCSIGKMVAALEVQHALADRGADAQFLATGQTGIMISGDGVPIDCVVSDFVNGAAEQLVQRHQAHDYLVIEGQGSISHPAFSAVTLGLLHGAAPDGLIFCYEAGREFVKGLEGVRIPALPRLLDAYLSMANLRRHCRFIGVAVNTRTLSAEQADTEIARVEVELGLPACDVYRHGADTLASAAVQLREELLLPEADARQAIHQDTETGEAT